MEKKTMDTLRSMICGELDDIAKKGVMNHEQLDILKDLLESAKNLEKIEKYQKEKDAEWESMDRGYSQRKYYIDADYEPYGRNSYAYGGRGGMGGNSYGNRVMYDMGGNSYMYHDPSWGGPMYSMARGYSRTGSKEDMKEELKQMMHQVDDERVKTAIQKAIDEM